MLSWASCQTAFEGNLGAAAVHVPGGQLQPNSIDWSFGMLIVPPGHDPALDSRDAYPLYATLLQFPLGDVFLDPRRKQSVAASAT